VPNDDINLRLKVTTEGVQQIAAVQQQILAMNERALKMQTEQAAVSTKQAAAIGQIAGQFANAERAAQKLEHAYTGVGETLVKLPGLMEAVRFAQEGITKGAELFGDVISAGADMEAWKASFGVLLGGSDEAVAHLAYLKEFAKTSSFDLPNVIEASKLLEALNLNTKEYIGTLSNVAAFLHRPLNEAVLAISQARVGELQNLKSFGVDIQAIAAKAGVDLMEGGRRSASDSKKIAAEVMEFWKQKFGEDDELIAKTTSGRFSALRDEVFQLLLKISESGVGDLVRGELEKILSKIAELEKNGTLERWAKSVSGAMETFVHAAETGFNAALTLAENLDKLRAPIGFLIGSVGFLKLTGLVLAGVEAFGLWSEAAVAAGTSATVASFGVSKLSGAIMGLGGPIGIAIGLLGGIAVAAIFDDAHDQVEALKKSYGELDEELSKAAGPAAMRDATRATQDMRKELEAIGAIVPVELISDSELLRIDDATARMRGLTAEVARARSGGFNREAPIAPPVAAVRDARSQLGQTYGFHLGDTFADLATRGQAFAAPAKAAKATPPEVDPELAKAAKKAFDDAVKRAQDYVTLELSTGQKLAAAAADSIERRLGIEAHGAAERLKLLDKIEHDAVAKSIALGEAFARADQEIEDRRRSQVLAAASAPGATAAQIAQVQKVANEKAKIERQALDQSLQDGTFLLAFQRKLGDQRVVLEKQVADDVAEVNKKAAEDRNELAVEVLKFQLQTVKVGSDAWLKLLDDLAVATLKVKSEQDNLNEALGKFAQLGIDARKGRELLGRGISPENVADVGRATDTTGKEAADLSVAAQANASLDATIQNTQFATDSMRATWAAFFHDVGAGWDQAAQAALVASSGMAAAGTAAYNTLVAATTKWFKYHQGTHGLALQIVKSAAKEGAAASIEALAAVMRTEGAQEAAAAIRSVAKAIEFPLQAGQYLAAAGKHALAAAAYGVGAAVAQGGANALRAQNEEEQAGTPAAAEASGGSSQSTSTRLRTVAGNAPITQNFNVTIGFFGGLNLFGPEAAIALAREMRPVLQQMLNDRELVVPTSSGG